MPFAIMQQGLSSVGIFDTQQRAKEQPMTHENWEIEPLEGAKQIQAFLLRHQCTIRAGAAVGRLALALYGARWRRPPPPLR